MLVLYNFVIEALVGASVVKFLFSLPIQCYDTILILMTDSLFWLPEAWNGYVYQVLLCVCFLNVVQIAHIYMQSLKKSGNLYSKLRQNPNCCFWMNSVMLQMFFLQVLS